MPRRLRVDHPSYFHVLNRSVRRATLFTKPSDYRAFVGALAYAQSRAPVPLLSFCVMPNHFHCVVGPTLNPELSAFMHRLTLVHSKRWHRHFKTEGTGPVYQGRFKAIPISNELHLLLTCRYVERNPLRAGLVQRAEMWPWSSLNRDRRICNLVPIAPWPIPQPASWVEIVNAEETGFLKKPGFLDGR